MARLDVVMHREIAGVLDRFMVSGEVESTAVRAHIAESWSRCRRDSGEMPASVVGDPPVGRVHAALQVEFATTGALALADAHEALARSETIAVVADVAGVVLDAKGDSRALQAAVDIDLIPSAVWTERARGTNAIGTALCTGRSVEVHGPEHFAQPTRSWTCAGALVHDPVSSLILGVVSVAGLSAAYNPCFNVLALSIAARIKSDLMVQELTLRERLLERTRERLANATNGLLVFDRRGRFLTGNPRGAKALRELGLVTDAESRTQIAGFDLLTALDGRYHGLPEWVAAEWLEPIGDGPDCVGTWITIPNRLRREAGLNRGGLPAYKLNRVMEFVGANLSRVITLTDLAQVADVSAFHFHRQFKKSTGSTPHQFIVRQRIEHAKSLLAQSQLPIIDIAEQVGFTDQSHFTTTFRKLTSMTPRIFRNASRC